MCMLMVVAASLLGLIVSAYADRIADRYSTPIDLAHPSLPVAHMVAFYEASDRLAQTLTDRAVAEALEREFGDLDRIG